MCRYFLKDVMTDRFSDVYSFSASSCVIDCTVYFIDSNVEQHYYVSFCRRTHCRSGPMGNIVLCIALYIRKSFKIDHINYGARHP